MKKFKDAPIILKIFAILSVFVVFGHFMGLAFFSQGYLKIQPYIGSNSYLPYLFGNLYFFPNKKPMSYDKAKLLITRLFVLIMVFGIGEIYLFDRLVVNVPLSSVIWYRILSVFAIPILWIVLLSKKFESLVA